MSDELKYSVSYIAAGLMLRETESILHLLQKDNTTELLKKEVIENQYLQVNTESARKRIVQELVKRHQSVNPEFWDMYDQCSEQERKICLFYTIIKTYRLIFDYHFDVTLPRWKSSDNTIDTYYYQMKLDEIGMDHPDVDEWSDTTKLKSITVYLRILREAGLLKENTLQKLSINDDFWCYFIRSNNSWFLDACFVNMNQKKEIINNCK